jgi:multidrug efflux pump subunit AcrA (membrane-fusion protein)
VPNGDLVLKPGMFARVTVVLDRVEDAVVVPEPALARRENADGVFVLSADGRSVGWREVGVGFRQGERVQITAGGLGAAGEQVVVLGQQLLDDGSEVSVSERPAR